MKTISFAVPCYNSAAYMDTCIESILKCGDDIEILIVNDGSTKDDTAAKADAWQERHPGLIRAIHKENGGHGSAVNMGLANATGRYFKVVDSDDWLDEHAMAEIMVYLRRQAELPHPTDLVIGNYVYEKVHEGARTVMHYRNVFPEGREFGWADVGHFGQSQYLLMHSVIYRTELLRDIDLKLPEHCFYVDNIFVYVPLPHVKTIYYRDVDMYRYFIGREDQSVNENVMMGRIDQQLRVTREMIDAVRLPDDVPEKRLERYMENYLSMMMCICSIFLRMIGTDEAEDSVDETHRSDTNIVVRVDPVNNQATMVSIPRDTKIEIDGYGTNKFNAAYSYDGAAGAIREANELLGIQISHYAEVNFGKLKDLVDAVGGVDVVVPERIDDPDADGTSAHPEWPRVIIEEGEQHLDGNQALVFARSRAYVDGDFTRTANQRKLIMAIVNKVLALNTAELLGAVQAAANCVTTDLAVGDIAALAQQFQDDGDLTIYSAMVPSTTAMIGDVSYVINDPVATKEMMKLVEAGEDPSSVVSSGYVDPGDTTGGASTYGNGYGSTGSGAATAQETPIITIRATPMHREPEGLTTAAMLITVTLTTVTLTTPAERVEPAGTTMELLLAVRAVPTVQADTTPAIPIRAPTTGRHPLLSRRLVGILELRKRHRLRSMPLLIGSSTGRLSFGSPVEFSYPLRDTGDHRLQRRMGLAKT